MNRPFLMALVAGSFVAGVAFESIAAGPGIFRPRNGSRGQTVTRTYRSYSVAPETLTEPGIAAPLGGTEVIGRPMTAPATSSPRTSTRSKPSYMRADSKASGRFGQ